MRFSYVCCLGVFAAFLLTLLTESCIQSKRKRAQPECLHGKNADGECHPPSWEVTDICQGNFGIKESGENCVFYTAAHPNGCIVSGLKPHPATSSAGCLIFDSIGNYCMLDGLDRANLLCSTSIKRDPAAVSIYLEVQEEGFKPHIVFDTSEKVQTGAALVLGEQSYRGNDIIVAKNDDGKTTLSMALKIPWELTYTKEDGTGICADGVLSGNNSSKETAVRGNICL